ncbi:hypothetical protein VFPFJ_11162 [Purpureocillium lilacinum]|uniref:Uncharacterized protein n=1 Tax=Purpureocillium lilacinum TaxID=33203 RepID=A0A179EYF7_PURLI|nr:hypothetical protein VFPFJ_11668 [Purpureocillium lilacinum]XP_018173168.1 hypothetical protein VFPFJ_11162 [Purpureocillium lilacinum]OAQ58208.1 hypothetical protein VFPFJ_11668 [Purpureocillium lilacinum]OAQ65749.1 hypothetical protein VFPFJ_11162 [Purpureocillium lilacinum]
MLLFKTHAKRKVKDVGIWYALERLKYALLPLQDEEHAEGAPYPAIMIHDTDKSTAALDDGFDKEMEEFFDYIFDAKAFEDMETYVNEGPEAVSTGVEQSSGDK